MSLAAEVTTKTQSYANFILSEEPFFNQLLNGNLKPESYANFLESVRYLVSHTPIHLKLAISESEQSPELRKFFEQKFMEEVGHDQWAVDDLKRIMPLVTTSGFQPSVNEAMKNYVMMIEDAIKEDPYLYPSYIYYTELLTVLISEPMNNALANKCGFGEESATIITSHAELDQEHIVEGEAALLELIDQEKYGQRTLMLIDAIIEQHKKFFMESIH